MDNFEREAFIKAYLFNVGYAPRKYVEGFLDQLDVDVEPEHDENYSNVADALGMWNSALYFANKQKGEP